MSRTLPTTVLAGLTALALAVSVVAPCYCFFDAAACHQEAQESDAHGCCESPAGVQAVADECCDIGPGFVMASTDVPDVAPPSMQARYTEHVLFGEQSMSPAVVRTPPPPPLDRTTVLLI